MKTVVDLTNDDLRSLAQEIYALQQMDYPMNHERSDLLNELMGEYQNYMRFHALSVALQAEVTFRFVQERI